MSFDERKIVTQSTNDADIGEHEIFVRVSLADYLDVQTTAVLKLIVNPCVVDDFLIQSGPIDNVYNIRSEMTSLSQLSVSQDLCGYEI